VEPAFRQFVVLDEKKPNERRLLMKNIIRNGALTLAIVAGGALAAAPATPAMAKSIQQDGYFGGTWGPIGPRNNYYVKRHHRRHYGYYGPYRHYGYYGPRYGYNVPPRYYGRGPGFSITIR
jgi:hypothetical protein